MKTVLAAAAIVLGLLSIEQAKAGDGECLAMSGSEGENTCGHTISVVVQLYNGSHGLVYLRPGESNDFVDGMGRPSNILLVCDYRRYNGGVRYSGGRPVGCE